MVKILKCDLIPKKSNDTLFKGAIFFGQPCIFDFFATNFIILPLLGRKIFVFIYPAICCNSFNFKNNF